MARKKTAPSQTAHTVIVWTVSVLLCVIVFVAYLAVVGSHHEEIFLDIGQNESVVERVVVSNLGNLTVEGRELPFARTGVRVWVPSGDSSVQVQTRVKGLRSLSLSYNNTLLPMIDVAIDNLSDDVFSGGMACESDKGVVTVLSLREGGLPSGCSVKGGVLRFDDALPSDTVVASNLPLPSRQGIFTVRPAPLIVSVPLRGPQSFIVGAAGPLSVSVLRGEAGGPIAVSFVDINGKTVADTKIEGEWGVLTTNVSFGTYRVEISDGGTPITQLGFNTRQVVWRQLVGGPATNAKVWCRFVDQDALALRDGAGASVVVSINESRRVLSGAEPAAVDDARAVILPASPFSVSSTGWCAFEKDSFFEPYAYRVVPLSEAASADLVVTDYVRSRQEGEWVVAQTTVDVFRAADGLVALQLVAQRSSKQTMPEIDWLNVTVDKDVI